MPLDQSRPNSSSAAAPERQSGVQVFHSACPHDCPSTCALEVELAEATGEVRRSGGPPQRLLVASRSPGVSLDHVICLSPSPRSS